LIARFDSFTLVTVYAPNTDSFGRKDYRVKSWDPDVYRYLSRLSKTGAGVVCIGDFNAALSELDIGDEKKRKEHNGVVESENLERFMLKHGFIDSFRALWP
jgi:exonuclease III